MTKITMRETLERALAALDHLGDCSDRDVSPEEWNVAKAEPACDALRAALAAQPAEAQQEPVAWRHSKTGRLYDSVEEVPLADGDEWAEPLYLAAPPQPVRLSDYDIWKNDVIMAANADIGLPMADLMKLVLAIEAAMAAKQTGENDGM